MAKSVKQKLNARISWLGEKGEPQKIGPARPSRPRKFDFDLRILEIKNDAGVNDGADLIHVEEVRSERIGPDTQRDPRNKSVVNAAAYFPSE